MNSEICSKESKAENLLRASEVDSPGLGREHADVSWHPFLAGGEGWEVGSKGMGEIQVWVSGLRHCSSGLILMGRL